MSSLPVLNGYCTIQLYKKIGGAHNGPNGIIYRWYGNTLVSEIEFRRLNQERWVSNKKGYVLRREVVNGKKLEIYMAREILGLPRAVGRVGNEADHHNHDVRDNTLENLSVATFSQNMRNRGKWGSECRFKGVCKRGNKFEARVRYNDRLLYLGVFKTDVEAALVYFYTVYKLCGEFGRHTTVPEDEMPTEARQEELWQMVLKRLRTVGLLSGA